MTAFDVKTLAVRLHQDVENNETKWKLFEKMVATCSEPMQLVSIHQLIQNWESFETEFAEDQNRNCLLKLSRRLIDIDPGGNDLLNLFKKVETRLDQVFPADIGKGLVGSMLGLVRVIQCEVPGIWGSIGFVHTKIYALLKGKHFY